MQGIRVGAGILDGLDEGFDSMGEDRDRRRCAECHAALDARRSTRRYCSDACRSRAARSRRKAGEGTRECLWCEEPISAYRRSDARYCSDFCRRQCARVRAAQGLRFGPGPGDVDAVLRVASELADALAGVVDDPDDEDARERARNLLDRIAGEE